MPARRGPRACRPQWRSSPASGDYGAAGAGDVLADARAMATPLESQIPAIAPAAAEAPASQTHTVHQPGLFGDESLVHPHTQRAARSADEFDARAAWQKLLGELQLQLEPNAYHTWLHDTWVEGYEDGEFYIGTPNTYARDWLENRLRPLVRKTLKSIVGRSVDVKFLVRLRQVKEGPGAQPLYAEGAFGH